MERTKKQTAVQNQAAPAQSKIKWKNVGGAFRFRKNEIIKPGQTFLAYVDEIPQPFRDILIPMEEIVETPEPTKIAAIKYSLIPTENNPELFNILDSEGKVMNEKPLKESIAKRLLQDLER